MRKLFALLFISSCCVVLMNCGEKQNQAPQTAFTKEDSLTDRYLAFHDSILQSWNVMINDDNQKIKSMHNLLHELLITSTSDRDQLGKFEKQLDLLKQMRYNQHSMGDEEVVEEYDFASATLVTELVSLAESKPEFNYNTTLQKLVEDIRTADQRVNNYREDYDYVVMEYNRFLERNKTLLLEINPSDSMQEKYLFKMVSTD